MPQKLPDRLLLYLRANAGRAISRDELAEMVWERKVGPYSRTIDSTIGLVRKALMPGEEIVTRFGFGYQFVEKTRANPSTTSNKEA